MRGMMHNSRGHKGGRHGYSPDHNDRHNIGQADNIDQARSKDNIYWRWCSADSNREAELAYYRQYLGPRLEKTNKSAVSKGHPERVKPMEEWMYLKRFCPEETTIQIGKIEEHATPEIFSRIAVDFMDRLQAWSDEHGKPFQLLDYAVHLDEAVPHCQYRKVWTFTDEDGLLRVGQERALEAAGVPLPEPDKPVSRTNNRKVTFDREIRELWLDVCREHGYTLEREPVPDGKHNLSKEQMIRAKYERLEDRSRFLEAAITERTHVAAGMDAIAPAEPDRKLFGAPTKTLPYDEYKALVASQEALRALQAAEEARYKAAQEKAAVAAEEARKELQRLQAKQKAAAREIAQAREQLDQLSAERQELEGQIRQIEPYAAELAAMADLLQYKVREQHFRAVENLDKRALRALQEGRLVALYDDGRAYAVEMNSHGGYDKQTLDDEAAGLCKVGVFEDEVMISIPEHVMAEIEERIPECDRSPDLQMLFEQQHAIRKYKAMDLDMDR